MKQAIVDALAPYSVLLVEDDPLVLDALARPLSRVCRRLVKTKNAEEALAALKEEKFDAVLTDVVLPGMSGLELVRTIRKTDSKTPLLVMTGCEESQVVSGAISAQADAFFKKPLNLEEILVSLAMHCQKKEGNGTDL